MPSSWAPPRPSPSRWRGSTPPAAPRSSSSDGTPRGSARWRLTCACAARRAVDGAAAARILHTNLVGPASLLTAFAARMAPRGRGTLVALASVAGDRGRGSNHAYGAAKGGLALFLQGLRNRHHRAGLHVLTVKPGFVDTPMTARVPHNALFADPRGVARSIVRAADTRRDVVYVPWFWRLIMLMVRSIPERVFKRLEL